METRQERADTREQLLDTAERLIGEVGYRDITTRRLAAEAGVRPGLVHYHFDSMPHLFACVLERVSERLLSDRQGVFSTDDLLTEQWRRTSAPLRDHRDLRTIRVWFEICSMATHRPELQPTLLRVYTRWREHQETALRTALERHGSKAEPSLVSALAAALSSISQGLYIERMLGFGTGHDELLSLLDDLLESIQDQPAARPGPRG